MNFTITTSSLAQCVTNADNAYTLFQVLLSSGSNSEIVFLVGVSYETSTVFQLFLKDSAGIIKHFEPRFTSNKQSVMLGLN